MFKRFTCTLLVAVGVVVSLNAIVAAAGSITGFYLSTNLTLDGSDTQLGTRTVAPLGPGLTDSGSLSLVIPSGTPAGTYYMIAAADSTNTIAETVESNNIYIRTIRISAAP